MEIRYEVEDMAIELQGAAMVLDDIINNRDENEWLDTCDVLSMLRGVMRRIGIELRMIAHNNDAWKDEDDKRDICNGQTLENGNVGITIETDER